MKKIFILLFLVIFINKGLSAQTLVLHHPNGRTTDVELLTLPQVKFQDDKVIIGSSILNLEFSKDDVLRFTYKGGTLGINNASFDGRVSQENGRLMFHGIKSSDKIAVYTAKGIRIPVNISRSKSSATLSLSSVPSGIYLLSINGRTSKFTKK